MQIYPPGSIIDNRYEIVSQPLMGGMGLVYFCIDHMENRPVALKTFRTIYLSDRRARDLFLREGTAWINLGQHPNIVRCYNIDRVDSKQEIYLALELVTRKQGKKDASLRSWLIPGKPLPLKQALLFTLQIVQGMSYANKKIPGFVHRDLKPENLLIGADKLAGLGTNRLRITDFGLANILEESNLAISTNSAKPSGEFFLQRTQLTNGVAGTPLYMAPEQWQGGQLGCHTDIYATGCILYEMITGEFTATGDSIDALKTAHCYGELRPLPTTLPVFIQELLSNCLMLRGNERYQTWDELRNALEDAWFQLTGNRIVCEEYKKEAYSEEILAIGWAYNSIGVSYQDIGNANVAQKYFEHAWSVGEAEEEYDLAATSMGNLGNAHRNLGNLHYSIDCFKQALIIMLNLQDQNGAVNALGGLGTVYLEIGQAELAKRHFEKALSLLKEYIEDKDQAIESRLLGNLGLAYRKMGDAHQAIKYFEEVLTICRKTENKQTIGDALGNLGTAYFQLDNFHKAKDYFLQRLNVAREIGNPNGEGTALGNLGLVYQKEDDYLTALTYHKQALEIMRRIEYLHGAGDILNNLGNTYKHLGNLQDALKSFEERLGIALKIGDRQGEVNGLGNLGLVCLEIGKTDQAIHYLEEALIVAREINDHVKERITLIDLGNIYSGVNNSLRAINYFQRALSVALKFDDRQGEAWSSWGLGEEYVKMGDLHKAVIAMQVCVDFEQSTGHPDAENDAATVAKLRSEID